MKAEYFENNRERLFKALGENFSYEAKSGDMNFWYLTGITQENVIYSAACEDGKVTQTLFLPETDPMKERWFGRMVHRENVKDLCGIENVVERKLHKGHVKKNANAHVVEKLRSIKCDSEISALRRAIEMTNDGIIQILKTAKGGMYEYNLRAEFEKVIADQGCHIPAFDTIVGAGKNSLCLHYSEEDAKIEDGDIILLDLGARYDYMCADISRVLPASGKFTKRQRLLCQSACDCLDYVCAVAKPEMTIKELNDIQDEYLKEKLPEIGLSGDVKQYRWHSISHHLGLETHDSCGRDEPVHEGSTFTLEVGIYCEDWGEGVRVEDDILMKKDGCENLSRFIPRDPDEIEAVMANR